MSQRVISFHYTLTDPAGRILDSSEGLEPLTFLQGVGQIIPGLENVLVKLKVGDKQRIIVKAADAYGEMDPNLILQVPRVRLPERDLKLGDRFRAGQGPQAPVVVVTQITDTMVTLDANHPLAGLDLAFDIEIIGIREATPEEIAHGHTHDARDHGHETSRESCKQPAPSPRRDRRKFLPRTFPLRSSYAERPEERG